MGQGSGERDAALEPTLDGAGELTLGPNGEREPAALLERGSSVGRYVVVSRLGAGAMGVVYAAFDPELDRKVALKLLHAHELGVSGRKGSERILREAQALARLNHPNVVTVHDLGEHAGHIFVAMEFVRGQTLKKWLAERRPSYQEILNVFCKAGAGLAAAHDKGLVHRDFKPDNVMIDDEGGVRVLDFGLARAVESAVSLENEDRPAASRSAFDSEVTRGDHLVGTPAYMAPEQHLREPISAASDQFSFCVALWEAFFGRRPFRGASALQISVSVTEGTIDDPPADSRVPKTFQAILRRGLEADPAHRFESMRALLDALSYDPTVRRRRALKIGAVVLSLGTFLGGWQVNQQRVRASCDAEGEAIATVYDDDMEGRIREAMLDTGAPGAQTSFDKTAQWIRRFVDAWRDARTRTCVAHRVEGTLDPELARRARECLDEQRVELEALLARINEGGAEPLWTTVNEAVSLPLPGSCTDWASLSRLPDIDEEVRERVIATTRELAELRARRRGDAEDVREETERLLAQAHGLGYEPLVARAHLTAAHLADRRGDFEEAETEGLEAVYVAGQSGADDLAAEAATDLSLVVGTHLGKTDQGLVWAHLALMWLDRLQVAEDDERRATALLRLGNLLVEKADYDGAIAQLRQVVAIREHALGPDHLDVALAVNDLGWALSEAGDHEAAIEHYERALAIWERAAGTANPHLASILNNLGALHFRRDDMQRALDSYAKALRILESVRGPDHPEVASCLSNMALAHARADEIDLAQAKLERALRIAESSLGSKHPTTGALLNHLAMLQLDRKAYEQALPLLEQSLRIVEDTAGPRHPDVVEVVSNLGMVYANLGDLERALDSHRRALEITESTRGPDHPKVVEVLERIADVYRTQGNASREIELRQRAIDVCEQRQVRTEQCARLQIRQGRLLWDAGRDRQGALALVEQGRSHLAEFPHADRDLINDTEKWLTRHRPTASP